MWSPLTILKAMNETHKADEFHHYLWMPFRGAADSSNTQSARGCVLPEGGSYPCSAWCALPGCARSSDQSPARALMYSWAVLRELRLLGAEFSAATSSLSSVFPDRVLLWSQVSWAAISAHGELWKPWRCWHTVARVKHSHWEVWGAGLSISFHSWNSSLERASALCPEAKFCSGWIHAASLALKEVCW